MIDGWRESICSVSREILSHPVVMMVSGGATWAFGFFHQIAPDICMALGMATAGVGLGIRLREWQLETIRLHRERRQEQEYIASHADRRHDAQDRIEG